MTTLRLNLWVRTANATRALRLIWASAPRWTLGWAALLMLQGLLPAAFVSLTRLFVDELVGATQGGWERLRPVLLLGALLGAVLLLSELLQSLADWVYGVQAELVQDHISALIHKKSAAVDLAFYDSPEYYDHLYRARDDAAERPLELLEGLGGLARSAVTMVALAALLASYGLWLPLLLLGSALPALGVVLAFDRRYHRWWHSSTPERRRAQYYDDVLNDGDAAAEIRLFGLAPSFQRAFLELRATLRERRRRLTRDQALARAGAATLALLISGGALVWMAGRVVEGQATLGELALFYQALERGQTLVRELLRNVGRIYANTLYLSHLFEFLDLEPQVAEPAAPAPLPARWGEVRFRDVTFRYPGDERLALDRFSLAIPAGQTVAIVGENGAGKTTLLKLLCRFYDPDAGLVEVGGANIRALPLAELRRQVTVLFQHPVRYHASAADNIGFGVTGVSADAGAIVVAARAAGAHELIEGLPQGYSTLLGKWFAEGVELSGGEWQRVALARALVRPAPIVVLDEPTSFMDSWAEARWLDRLEDLLRDRTALIVTHRFTTAMRADIIHVLDGGRIVESGTHADLLSLGGRYAQSWWRQVQDGASDPAEVVNVP